MAYKVLYEKMLDENTRKHRKALEMVDNLWEYAEKVEKKMESLLDNDDPVLERFGKIIGIIMHLSTAIQDEIEKDIIIDPEDI